MPGHQLAGLGQVDAGFLFQHPDDRQTDRHQGRLGVLGQPELVLRTFEHQPGQVLRQGVVDLLEEMPRHRRGLGQFLAHADGLAALSREYEGPRHD